MEFRYRSENTLQYIWLHDCDCSHMYYEGGREGQPQNGENTPADAVRDGCLVFEMEWMEILREHPCNPFALAHQSGEGRIELWNPCIVECTLDMDDGESRALNDIRELDFREIEFMKYEESGEYCANMYMLFDRGSKYHGIFMCVKYTKSVVMWDDFNGVSWFEELK